MAGEMLELAGESREAIGRIVKGIEAAVTRSYLEDKLRDGHVVMTSAEVKRRTNLCVEVARALRAELGWSVARIVDELPKALRAKLDGTPWDPKTIRTLWTPDGS
jgi:hypothetical protein